MKSDNSLKLYPVLTDGKTLPTIRQHMAKICPFLESKADIFSCYLPVSDMNLAIEKKHLAQPLVSVALYASCLLSQMDSYLKSHLLAHNLSQS